MSARREVLEHLLRVKKASQRFPDFVAAMHPEWKRPWFHEELLETLDALERRELKNEAGGAVSGLLVNMPPRYSKSEICTILFPVYYMARDPTRNIMSANYNAILARDFGRKVRNTAREDTVLEAFPKFRLAAGAKSVDAWMTTKGGSYFSVGLGATTSGRPATCLIVDDPIKNRKEAESANIRKDVWDYYVAALDSRLQPELDGSEPIRVVVMTRWHVDDLAGKLMTSEGWASGCWKQLCWPAIIDDGTDRRRALWPERFSLESLDAKKQLNQRDFSALYQQQPYLEGGEILKRSWWQYYTDQLVPEQFAMVILVADTAIKTGEENDYSVIGTFGLTGAGDIFILDIQRGKWEFHDLKLRLVHQATRWRGRGLRGVYVEDKQNGGPLVQELKRDTFISAIAYQNFTDKVARAHMVSPTIESGRVFIPNVSSWTKDFLAETEAFPNAEFDDQVDVLTIALDILSRFSLPENFPMGLEGRSLLEEYNRGREIILGKPGEFRKKSIRAMKGAPRWRGWGV